ncbi:7874_t:CDS:2 [Ambispora gerdemannii]|uniref:7874_t:CDS:1 n=1 Tax=Ambispora gerdemannii TaxID=144530 RepID=A0A9N9FD74_9GLOM|nr:7874_t:CDS:2 [Ambispora gerdemannii]
MNEISKGGTIISGSSERIIFRRDHESDDDFQPPKKRKKTIISFEKEIPSGINEVNSPGYGRPHTPPHQIHSTSKNQDLLRRLRGETQQAKSPMELICSNIMDTTNKHLMKRLKLNRDYHWGPIINDTTKYIDELIENSDICNDLRQKLQAPFVPSGEIYSFDKHYELNWYLYSDTHISFLSLPLGYLLVPLIDDFFLTYDMEYFGAETFIDEDPHNSKPISYKYKLFREMKDQLDRLLKKLKFTKETIKKVESIVLHGGFNGTMYAMHYDVDLKYYFVFELCQYRIGTTLIEKCPRKSRCSKGCVAIEGTFLYIVKLPIEFLIISS